MSEGFRSRVGFVFQNSDAQVFSPTVREEIAFGPLQLGLSRTETASRVADVAAMLGITDLLDRAPFQLSGGQKKKVAIATVLVMGPEVLLFDEPTAALDPRTQYWLEDLIDQLGASGKTIVLATHDLDLRAPHREPRRHVQRGSPGGRRRSTRADPRRPSPAARGEPHPRTQRPTGDRRPLTNLLPPTSTTSILLLP